MDIEKAKLDIIHWLERTNNERLIYKIQELRTEELNFKNELSESQKIEIIRAINTLDEN